MAIKVVLLDIGNVLTRSDQNRAIWKYILRYHVREDLARSYFARPDYMATGKGLMEWEDYCQRLRDEWRVGISDDQIFRVDASHIDSLDHGAMDLVDLLLGTSGIDVGFVTNTRKPEWRRYLQLEPRFGAGFQVWRSDIFHQYKADPGVPEAIIGGWMPKNLGVRAQPGEVLFVDDSPKNCAAFEAIGVLAFQYTEGKPWLLEAYFRANGILG